MERNKAAEVTAAKSERDSAILKREAAYATPGTAENRAYHAKLDAIHAQAVAMLRAKGR